MSNNHKGESDVTPTESQIIRTAGNFPHGNREIPETSVAPMAAERSEKAKNHTSDMHVSGKSDSFVVPKKRANKTGLPTVAESVEGRELTKENAGQSLLDRTQCRNRDGMPFLPRSRGLSGVRSARPGIVGPSTSKVRAVCGSSARTDLCGGPPERAVPTAIVFSRFGCISSIRLLKSIAAGFSGGFSEWTDGEIVSTGTVFVR